MHAHCWLDKGKDLCMAGSPKRETGVQPNMRASHALEMMLPRRRRASCTLAAALETLITKFITQPQTLTLGLLALEMMLPRRRRRASCTLAAAFLHGRSMRRRSRMVRTPYRRISPALHAAGMVDSMPVHYSMFAPWTCRGTAYWLDIWKGNASTSCMHSPSPGK